jgi:hypothetical protein
VQIPYYLIGRFFLFNHHDLASLGGQYSLDRLKAKSHQTISMFFAGRGALAFLRAAGFA